MAACRFAQLIEQSRLCAPRVFRLRRSRHRARTVWRGAAGLPQPRQGIMGSKSVLLRTLVAASSAKTAGFGVPSFVPKWRARRDSNSRPVDPKSTALSTELRAHFLNFAWSQRGDKKSLPLAGFLCVTKVLIFALRGQTTIPSDMPAAE